MAKIWLADIEPFDYSNLYVDYNHFSRLLLKNILIDR